LGSSLKPEISPPANEKIYFLRIAYKVVISLAITNTFTGNRPLSIRDIQVVEDIPSGGEMLAYKAKLPWDTNGLKNIITLSPFQNSLKKDSLSVTYLNKQYLTIQAGDRDYVDITFFIRKLAPMLPANEIQSSSVYWRSDYISLTRRRIVLTVDQPDPRSNDKTLYNQFETLLVNYNEQKADYRNKTGPER
jgi:hypothetical protein